MFKKLVDVFRSKKAIISLVCLIFALSISCIFDWQNKNEKHWQKACKVAFGEVNPVVVKHLLKRLDVFISDECRTPLSKANSTSVKAVDKFLREI